MSIQVSLPKFEGPLALLLYLIRKEEMDVFDIDINAITKQYFEYIRLMRELDLEVAGEFVAMAATLIDIKSRLLLAQYNEQGEIEEAEDPRRELVQRLLEYQKFQEISKSLYERPLLGRDTWPRGQPESFDNQHDSQIEIDENALFALISMYRRMMKNVKRKVHKVAAKGLSIAARILQIRDRFVVGQRIMMSDLIDQVENKKQQVLITFLALLELGKMGFVSVFQADIYGDIYVDPKREIENDAVSRVEEYDAEASEMIASRLVDAEPFPTENDSDSPLITASVTEPLVDSNEFSEDGVVAATDEEILAEEGKV